jgi:biopolymer transport protein ExbD
MQLNNGVSLQSEINVTPLVDVVLVLLIIFMVVVPLLLEGYDVGMPKTSAAGGPPPTEETQLVLMVRPETCSMLVPPAGEGLPTDCRVTLADREIPVSELSASVAEILGGRPADQHVLFLAADDRMNYEGILRIVDLARAGVDDLRIEFLTD